MQLKKSNLGTSLVVKGVKISISNVGGAGSISAQGVKIPHASWPRNRDIKQKKYCNKFNKDFKMVPIKNIFFKVTWLLL